MLSIESNTDIEIRIFARALGVELKKYSTYQNLKQLKEIETANKLVTVVNNETIDDATKLIVKANTDEKLAPRVFIGFSHNIEKFLRGIGGIIETEILQIENQNDDTDKKMISLKKIRYDTSIRAVIIARSSLAIKELQINFMLALDSLRQLDIPQQIIDTEDNTVVKVLTNATTMILKEYQEGNFTAVQVEDNSNITAVMLEFKASHEHIKAESIDNVPTLKKYIVKSMIKETDISIAKPVGIKFT